MQPRRITERIDGWGQYEGRVGFIMHFTDGTSETFLFDLNTAQALCAQGTTLVESIRQAQQAAHQPHSGVGMGDAARLRLVSKEE
jgi:hypothetical protein